MKNPTFFVCVCLTSFAFGQPVWAQKARSSAPIPPKTSSIDRVQDGLKGPVRRVRIETAKIAMKDGKPVEGPKALAGIATYDDRGRRIESAPQAVGTGTESEKKKYRYDNDGNVIEMVSQSDDGSVLSQEIYEYEFDKAGNWKKMTTSVAVDEDGKTGFEPIQVTYRTITYYHVNAVDHIATALAANAEVASGPASEKLPERVVSNPPKTQEPAAATLGPVRSGETILVGTGRDLRKEPVKSVAWTTRQIKEAANKGAADNSPVKPVETSPPAKEERTPETAQTPQAMAAAVTSPLSSNGGKPSVANRAPGSGLETDPPPTTSVTESQNPGTSSDDAAYFYKQGLSHLTFGRYSQAVESLRQAIQLYPDNAVAYSRLGLAYSALRQYTKAVAAFKTAISIQVEVLDSEAYYRLGEAYAALGKHSDSLKAFKQAMYITRAQTLEPDPNKYKDFPAPVDLHCSIGLEYYNLTRYDAAIKEFSEAAVLKPGFAEAHFGLAMAYAAIGNRKLAEQQETILRPLNTALADKVRAALSLSHVRPPGITEGILGRPYEGPTARP